MGMQVGDEDRGYLLELLLTKLRYMHARSKLTGIGSEASSLQIIGMSATMPNLRQVASWLDAEVFETKFRPVKLDMMLKVVPCLMPAVKLQATSGRWLHFTPDHEKQGQNVLVVPAL